MRWASVDSKGKGAGGSGPRSPSIDTLALHIGRLLRHPAYRREAVVSPLSGIVSVIVVFETTV